MRVRLNIILWLVLLSGAIATQAQIDPVKRELIQLGYNQPLQGRGPISAYAFYYLNLPHYFRTNVTLRLAIAPIYVDGELGLGQALGPNTDVGIGLSGGGFADSYSEVRGGKYLREESFTGHGGGAALSLYHCFNSGSLIPLTGILRVEPRYSTYSRDSDTAPDFQLPSDRTTLNFRSGVRWGGREPLLLPDVAMELSAWHEAQVRTDYGSYGFAGDRNLKSVSQLAWARALLAYTLPELKHSFLVNVTLGTSYDVDRFSAYRLGGILPMAAEFPLTLPGYYFQEISARQFVMLGGNYSVPLDRNRRWALNVVAATAGVDYAPGLQQPGHWHSGVGGGIGFRSPSDAWQIAVGYAYGIDAIRDGGRGAHSVGISLQFDLERANVHMFDPGDSPNRSRGLQRLFRGNFF